MLLSDQCVLREPEDVTSSIVSFSSTVSLSKPTVDPVRRRSSQLTSFSSWALDSMVRDGDTDSSGFSTREAFSPLTVVGVVLANSEAKQSEDLGEIVRITRTSGGTHSVVYDW